MKQEISSEQAKIVVDKITPEQARNLVADALESGDYTQGRNLLEDLRGHNCCLGVACRVYSKYNDINIIKVNNGYRFNGCKFELPQEVQDWLGFTSDCGEYYDEEDCINRTLIGDNDTRLLSFEEIAKKFRNPPKGLVNDS